MRTVEAADDVVVLELRGGTHLLLLPGEPTGGDAGFDLMVDDLEASREQWVALGLDPTPVAETPYHYSFDLRDPDGYTVQVSNTHVAGPV